MAMSSCFQEHVVGKPAFCLPSSSEPTHFFFFLIGTLSCSAQTSEGAQMASKAKFSSVFPDEECEHRHRVASRRACGVLFLSLWLVGWAVSTKTAGAWLTGFGLRLLRSCVPVLLAGGVLLHVDWLQASSATVPGRWEMWARWFHTWVGAAVSPHDTTACCLGVLTAARLARSTHGPGALEPWSHGPGQDVAARTRLFGRHGKQPPWPRPGFIMAISWV